MGLSEIAKLPYLLIYPFSRLITVEPKDKNEKNLYISFFDVTTDLYVGM